MIASVAEAAKAHARAEYPKEACGVVVAGVYYPCKNIAEDPTQDFVIDPADLAGALTNGKLEMVIHSHPNGPVGPSRADMEGQIKSGVAWGLIVLDEDRIGDPLEWGGNTPIAPLLMRPFIHGIYDCYSLIRETYLLGKEGCAAQDIDWPFDPIELPMGCRDDAWWDKGEDLYMENFGPAGFKQIDFTEAQPGDLFLCSIRSSKLNHGGLLMPNSLVMHHLPNRPSRREPAGLWARQADMWLRYAP
jgi:proteasome lid subunit RPN8/RPN11